MMHIAWSSMKELPFCFQVHQSILKVTRDKKAWIFTRIWHFRTVTSVWMATIWCTKLEVGWERCSIVNQGHLSICKVTWDKKSPDFKPNWVFLDSIFSLHSLMVTKLCPMLEVTQKMYPIVFKVIRQISRPRGTWNRFFYQNSAFLDCNSSLILPMAMKWCTKLEVA